MLAAGLVMAGVSTFSITKQVLEGSTIIDETALEPNLSIAAEIIDLPTGQQLLLSIVANPPDVPLQAKITGPNGDVLALYNITSTPFTSTTTSELSGNHTLEIKNIGSIPVTVSGGLLHSPIGQEGGGVSVQDNPSLQSLITYGVGILVGIVLIIAGIVILIIGAIKYARGRKSSPPSNTSQNN